MHPEIMAIGALGAMTAGAFGWFFSWYATIGGYDSIVIAVGFALLYILFFPLRLLVTENRPHAGILIGCDLVLFLLPFIGHFSLWLAATAAIAAIWLFAAWRQGRRQTENMVHIRLKDLAYGFVKSTFRAVLFLGIATYLSLVDPKSIAVSRTLIENSLSNIMSSANRGFMEQIVGREITPEESADAISRIASSIEASAEAVIGKVPPKAKSGILVGVGLVIFLLASSLINLLIPLVMGFVWCVLRLLLKLNFITITTEKADKETIVT